MKCNTNKIKIPRIDFKLAAALQYKTRVNKLVPPTRMKAKKKQTNKRIINCEEGKPYQRTRIEKD